MQVHLSSGVITPVAAPAGVKLGCRLAGPDPRLPRLASAVDPSVVVPRSVHRSDRSFAWGMLGNDSVGDCVEAAMLHAIEHMHLGAWTTPPTFADQDALNLYGAITGYDPSNPSTDQGTDPNQAIAYWQNHGVPVGDGVDRIATAAQVDPADGMNVRRGIWEFDVALLSLALPISAQQQTTWDVVGNPKTDPNSQPGSWGYHEVVAFSYDSYRVAFCSWGQIMLMTWRFFGAYCQLVLVPLSTDVIGKTGVSETGVNYPTLQQQIVQL
jgi:hypothetical protein